jgi:hypothetical protein
MSRDVAAEVALEQVSLKVSFRLSSDNHHSIIVPHSSPQNEVSDNPDQAAHYHILGL